MAYLELLSRESLAAAKNPSPPHLSQTPKTPRTYFRKKKKKTEQHSNRDSWDAKKIWNSSANESILDNACHHLLFFFYIYIFHFETINYVDLIFAGVVSFETGGLFPVELMVLTTIIVVTKN